jgi:hypothetical protein
MCQAKSRFAVVVVLLVAGFFAVTGLPSTASAAVLCHDGLWFENSPDNPEWCVSLGPVGSGNLWNYGWLPGTKYVRGNRFASPDGRVRCRFEPAVPRVGCYSEYLGYTKVLTDKFVTDRLDSHVGPAGRVPRLSQTRIWSKDGFECVVGLADNSNAAAVVCNSVGGYFGISARKDWGIQ